MSVVPVEIKQLLKGKTSNGWKYEKFCDGQTDGQIQS